jgi:outer membrane protein assembly factor BamE (lipoprotein component of BamABCDE complex)
MRIPLTAFASAALLAACATPQYATRPLSDDLFRTVQVGMTQDDVRRMLGTPDETMPFPLSRTVAWDYRTRDTWGYLVDFSVTFDASGHVVSRYPRRVNDGGDKGSN